MKMLALFGVLALALLISVQPAGSHSDGAMTYDVECCNLAHCAPVTEIKKTEQGLYVATPIGAGFVPDNMIRRRSKDHRTHMCYYLNRVYCIYFPDSM